jgi:SAM-dependent methyltransferase/adenylate kinase family enzyme
MKRLIFINGTMGAGKTATCSELLKMLDRSVFLDGDWCWMMDPFVVTDETKEMVQDNIVHLLRSFLSCSEYENVIFCWVMQDESIMDGLLSKLKDRKFELYRFTLMISEQALRKRIYKDVENHIRTPDVLERSLQRLPLYEKMNTVKINVSNITARQAAEQIAETVKNGSEENLFLDTNDTAGMKRRLSFNEDVRNYDKWRPRYTKEVFENVIRYAGIDKGKRALEVGIGTGQATEPFLKTGCSVTAVEVGKNLAGYAKEKFRMFSNLSIVNMPFENFREQDTDFDLIYSATAFHWIPEKIGFPKAFRLLKSGGALALWWNWPTPGRPDDELYRDIQKVYEKYRPGGKKPVEDKTSRYRRMKEIILSYGFTDLEFQLYHDVRMFDADGYIQLLNTYSDHGGIPSDEKQSFESEIKQAIRNHGNRLTLYDTIDLYLARKP